MGSAQLEILPIADNTLVNIFERFGEDIRDKVPGPTTFKWSVEGVPYVEFPFEQLRGQIELNAIQESSRRLLNEVSVIKHLPRGTLQASCTRDSTGNCTVRVTVNEIDNDLARQVVVNFKALFDPYLRSNLLADLNPTLADFYNRRDEALLRLEDLNGRLIIETEKHGRDLDQQFLTARADLERQHNERLRQLETDHTERLQSLEERSEALRQREKDLDNRENTHVRRQIYKHFKDSLKQRNTSFRLTPDTAKKRWPIVGAFMTVIAATLVFTGLSLYWLTHPISDNVPAWFPVLRLALSVGGFLGASLYYIRWQDRWSQVHADEEFRLMRLDLDMDRASWLAEMMLEWRREEGGELPAELLEKLATGLFETGASRSAARHPIEDLAAILASPASVNVKMPGGEFHLDRKGMNRLDKNAKN